MIVGLDGWGHIRVDGADHLRFLQGICTINITAMATGAHAWGAMLSPKGRVLTVIEATRGDDHVIVHAPPVSIDATAALLEKYAVMDDVAFTRVEVVAHKLWPSPEQPSGAAWDAAIVMAPASGPLATDADVEIVRVTAGIPRYGVDVDEHCFPFETPLVRFIDYGKGCYIGQEPVFRVHSQGNAARTLRAIALDAPVAPGTPVEHAERANAGTVTSAVISPRLGPIALAYLHRTVWEPGGEVTVGGVRGTIRELPI